MRTRLPLAMVLVATAASALAGCATYGGDWGARDDTWPRHRGERDYYRGEHHGGRHYADRRGHARRGEHRRRGERRHGRGHGRRDGAGDRGPRHRRAPAPHRLDRVLSRRVHRALDSRLDAPAIRVSVRQGKVYLSGHVRNRHHRQRAERIAGRVEGVKRVNCDELRVGQARRFE